MLSIVHTRCAAHFTTSLLSVEEATVLAVDRPLWRLLAASEAMDWIGAS